MNKFLSLGLLMLLILTGCNKKFSDIFSRNDNRLVVNDANFDFLSAKAKISFDSENNSLSGTANVRIKKDSIIWVSLSPGLGVEVARIIITQDSISYVDKINKKYDAMGFDSLSRKLDFEVTYKLVESVILGNLIYPYEREKVVRKEDLFGYRMQQGNFSFENFIGVRSKKLEKVMVSDTLTGNSIAVNYQQFQLVEEEVFPFLILAIISYKEKSKRPTRIEIEYKQTQIEKKPLKFPFNVPQRYERI